MFEQSVVGQARALRTLRRVLGGERMPHAMLFYGPEETGKVAAALETARSLHCDDGSAGACNTCRSCRKTAAMNHPDFSVLLPFPVRTSQEAEWDLVQKVIEDPYGYPALERSATISVDRIRELQRRFSYGSYEGAWRTAVILHADQMRPEGANALLKTLEEPPDRSLLLLTAHSVEALLPTLVSRCQAVKYPALSSQEVSGALVNRWSIGADVADFVARASGGNLRRAIAQADADLEDIQDRAYRFLEALIWGEEYPTYAALENLASDRQKAIGLLEASGIWLRDVLVYSHGGRPQVLHHSRLEDLERLSHVFDLERLSQALGKVQSLLDMNQRHVNLLVGLVSFWRQLRGFTSTRPTAS
ncbi:MAG: DNA polymerase III subunit delta' [Candidatus Latescibacteria bacterium]|jgi:DNA polymerase-3 subunit delta'|nr:DNA polymerase III subunit delta' [Candidatus Latescibacterota bacterium]